MVKIINGKRYDTERAEDIYTWTNGFLPGNFSYINETLYRKRTGEFFLDGYGGANTQYAEVCGMNEWSGARKIIPLSYEAAQEWMEKHAPGELYEEVFGEVVEDDTKVKLTLTVTATTAAKLRMLATKQGRSISAIIDEWTEKASAE